MQPPRTTGNGRQKTADLEIRKPFRRTPWWLRAVAAMPLPVWYFIAEVSAWIAEHALRHHRALVNAHLQLCFPGRDAAWIAATRRSFYRNFAGVICEMIKAIAVSKDEIRRRVRFVDADPARVALDAGQSILVVTSHNCNWEWTLLALSIGMGHPVHAAYKPLVRPWNDRFFLTLRSRFGAQMIASGRLLMRVLRHRGQARIVAMVADQNPVSSSNRYFAQFFGQDTAFYLGPDVIARTSRMPVYYLAMRREARGFYTVTFEPIADAGEELAEGAIIDRYAKRVEALTREHPADWLWTYRRWKIRGPQAAAGEGAASGESSGPD
ncbi:MAG: lysophospholipid acyltransferase family protein [Steroidobacteraceae bacterium]